MALRTADILEAMETTPDPAFESRLAELRSRLKQARDERGGCPSWDDLRADLLPGGKNREGREARLAHRAICPYCESHVVEWKRSVDHAADRLEAVERGFVRGLAGGARGLVKRLANGGAPARAKPERDDAPPREAPREDLRAAPREASHDAAPEASPTRRPATRPAAVPATPPLSADTRLLVVEMRDARQPPESVFLCAAALDAQVAVVPTLAELENDPDLALVMGIVLAGTRPPAEWPGAVRSARALVPGRPVVLLATYGVEPTAGARRALGDALLPEGGPAEHLLLALDRTLR